MLTALPTLKGLQAFHRERIRGMRCFHHTCAEAPARVPATVLGHSAGNLDSEQFVCVLTVTFKGRGYLLPSQFCSSPLLFLPGILMAPFFLQVYPNLLPLQPGPSVAPFPLSSLLVPLGAVPLDNSPMTNFRSLLPTGPRLTSHGSLGCAQAHPLRGQVPGNRQPGPCIL